MCAQEDSQAKVQEDIQWYSETWNLYELMRYNNNTNQRLISYPNGTNDQDGSGRELKATKKWNKRADEKDAQEIAVILRQWKSRCSKDELHDEKEQ